jgi:hypothetical protein
MTDDPSDNGSGVPPSQDGTREASPSTSEPIHTVDVQPFPRRVIPGRNGGRLTPFPKGHVANPEGGRKRKEIHAAYARLGQMTVAELEHLDTTTLTVFEMAAYRELERTLIASAMVGHLAMIEVSDRIDGKVAQKIYASQGTAEELDNLSDEELQERVKELRKRNQ